MRTLNVVFGLCGIVGGIGTLASLPLLSSLGLGLVPAIGFGFGAAAVLRVGAGLTWVGLAGTDREQFTA